MAEICYGVVSQKETSPPCETSSAAVGKRKMEIRKIKSVAGVTLSSLPDTEKGLKRPRLEFYYTPISRVCDSAVDNFVGSDAEEAVEKGKVEVKDLPSTILWTPTSTMLVGSVAFPKFDMASVCGRRRNMEDAVIIHPWFCRTNRENDDELHY